jgi:hypothetical protein
VVKFEPGAGFMGCDMATVRYEHSRDGSTPYTVPGNKILVLTGIGTESLGGTTTQFTLRVDGLQGLVVQIPFNSSTSDVTDILVCTCSGAVPNHNLFPFEFLWQGWIAMFGVGGAGLAHLLRKILARLFASR